MNFQLESGGNKRFFVAQLKRKLLTGATRPATRTTTSHRRHFVSLFLLSSAILLNSSVNLINCDQVESTTTTTAASNNRQLSSIETTTKSSPQAANATTATNLASNTNDEYKQRPMPAGRSSPELSDAKINYDQQHEQTSSTTTTTTTTTTQPTVDSFSSTLATTISVDPVAFNETAATTELPSLATGAPSSTQSTLAGQFTTVQVEVHSAPAQLPEQMSVAESSPQVTVGELLVDAAGSQSSSGSTGNQREGSSSLLASNDDDDQMMVSESSVSSLVAAAGSADQEVANSQLSPAIDETTNIQTSSVNENSVGSSEQQPSNSRHGRASSLQQQQQAYSAPASSRLSAYSPSLLLQNSRSHSTIGATPLQFGTTTATSLAPTTTTSTTTRRPPPSGPFDPIIVCYLGSWSTYRPSLAKFTPENINPFLCTHVIYAFAGLSSKYELKPFDSYNDITQGGYRKFTSLKEHNKQLKTLIAVGGWNEGSSR